MKLLNEASPSDFQYPIVFLPCRDLQTTRLFYNRMLGFPIALDQGSCLIFRVGTKETKGYWGFCVGASYELADPERICLTLVVSTQKQVDQWHAKLAKLCIVCKRAPSYRREFHIYNTFFQDPSNYSLEIQAFDSEHAPQ